MKLLVLIALVDISLFGISNSIRGYYYNRARDNKPLLNNTGNPFLESTDAGTPLYLTPHRKWRNI